MSDDAIYEGDPSLDDVGTGGSEELPEFEYDEDELNLVPVFLDKGEEGKLALRQIAEKVICDFDEAWESSSMRREMRLESWRLFVGDLPEKDFPFEHAANMHIPILMENMLRLVSRFEGEILGDRTNVFGVLPVGPDDKERAEVLSKHGNWQIREDIPDFFEHQRKGMLEYFHTGDVTYHSYYDPVRRQNRHEALHCGEFVTPFTYTTTMPDYSDCPYYVRILHLYPHEIQAMRDSWHGVDAVVKRESPSWMDEPDSSIAEGVAATTGIELPDEGGPHKVLLYEGWLDLPRQENQRWCQLYVDYQTRAIMKLTIHEEPDWKERARYEAQMRDRDRYFSAMDGYRQASEARDMAQAMVDSGDPEQAAMAQAAIEQAEIEPPMMPHWMQEPGDMPPPMERRPVYMFSHGMFMVPLAGSLGVGPGLILSDLNRAANTAMSQFSDAATLSNCSVLVTSQLVEFDRPFSFSPGAINKVNGVTGGELKNHIMPLDVKPGNPQLIDIVKFAEEKAQGAMQSPEVLSGAAGKSGETFRGIASRIEQATKSISTSARNYSYGPLRQVLRNNARLNAVHMPPDELLFIFNHKLGQSEAIQVGRDLYRGSYDVTISSDLKFNSEASKIADADFLVQMSANDPFLQTNAAFAWETRKRALEARGMHDMVQLLGPNPVQVQGGVAPMQPPMPQGQPAPGGSRPKGMAPQPSGPSGPAPEGPPQ